MSNTVKDLIKLITLIVTVGAVLSIAFILVPLALIFALNTLFGLEIAYNLATWFAALIITALLTARVNTSKSGSSTARKRLADGAKAKLSAEELAALGLIR